MRRAARLLSAVVAAQLTAIGLFAAPAQAGPAHGGGSVSVDQPLTDLFGTYGNTAGGWTYVYGVEDLSSQKFLHVARAPDRSARR